MGRARGRHSTGRHGNTGPVPANLAFSEPADSGEGREIGESELLEGHPLPGGINHLSNPETVHHKPDVGQPLPEFRGIMAHGVPPEIVGVRDRQHPEGPRREVKYEKAEPEPRPVPVRIVQAGSPKVLRVAATKTFMAPVITSEPVEICGEDANRTYVYVLNEDASNTCRIGELDSLAVDLANSQIVGGALLPKAMTGYLRLSTQRPLYVLGTDTTHTPRISVIIETEVQR